MSLDLTAEQAYEIWEIFSAIIPPKGSDLIAEQFVTWLIDNSMRDEDLEDLAKMDSKLGNAISEQLVTDEEYEEDE